MENILVLLIVGLAALYVARRFWKGAKADTSCGCGCVCSGDDSDCTANELIDPDFLNDRNKN